MWAAIIEARHYVAPRCGFPMSSKLPCTSHVPEALHRLTEVYLSLGVNNEAQNAAAVSAIIFPTADGIVTVTGCWLTAS